MRAKKLFCQNVFGPKFSHRNKYYYRIYNFTAFVLIFWHDAIDEWHRLLIQWLIQFVMFWGFYDKKSSNRMILDNYAIGFYSHLIFYITGKFLKIHASFCYSGNTSWFSMWLQTYKAATSMLSKNQNVTSVITILRFYSNK